MSVVPAYVTSYTIPWGGGGMAKLTYEDILARKVVTGSPLA